jgi:endonuclease/exonuclease/phosphatase family metal-dependent hydrolase
MSGVETGIYTFIFILSFILGSYFFLKILNKISLRHRTTRSMKRDPDLQVCNIHLLFYNVMWEPRLFNRFRTKTAKIRASMLADHVASFDLLGITGAFSFPFGPTSDFVSRCKFNGFNCCVSSPSATLMGLEICDGGNIILSKYPIITSEYFTFQLMAGVDTGKSKGAAYAKIQISEKNHIHFVTTSLQLPTNNLPESRSVRMNQVREIITALRKRADDGNPIVVAGTFNTDALSNEVIFKKPKSEYNWMRETFVLPDYTIIDLVKDEIDEKAETENAPNVYIEDFVNKSKAKRTDYIFICLKNNCPVQVQIKDSKIEEFYVNSKHFSHLSTHFGISTNLIFEGESL